MRRKALVSLALVALTFALYWPVRNYGLIEFDDPEFVREKPEITNGLTLAGFHWAFTKPVAANWHPITTLSHMLDCQVFDGHLGAHHLVNVALHSVNAALLFLFLTRLTQSFWRSALVSAIFAWHPLRVESVAWIAERKDVMGGLFFMLTLLAYVKYTEQKSRVENREKAETSIQPQAPAVQYPGAHLPSSVFYLLCLICFALGLMSKPMLVTVPFLLVLLDYWPLRRFELSAIRSAPARLWWEKAPFLALSAAASWFTIYLQKGGMPSLINMSLHDRVANAIVSYLKYLGKLAWPKNLAIIYPHPASLHGFTEQWPDWEVGLIALLLLVISALCLSQLVRRPYLAVGWFWYLGTMVPVIGLIQVGEQALADRYTYIPLIGPTIALVWLCGEGLVRCGMRPAEWGPESAKSNGIAALIALPLLAAGCVLTHQQIGYWRDTVTLFSHAAQVTANNSTAEFFVGLGLEKQGNPEQAMAHYQLALAINPFGEQAHYNLAQIFRKSGHWEKAAEHYVAVLRTHPTDGKSQLNLANVLPYLGRGKEAALLYNEVLQNDPDSIEAANNFAWLLATSQDAQLRNGARAIQLAQHACELTQYKMTTIVGTLAAAYAEAGRFGEAVATEEKACALAADSKEKELEQKNQELLALYKTGHPYRASSTARGASPEMR